MVSPTIEATSYAEHVGDYTSLRDGQASQFHKLVDGEGAGAHEFLVQSRGGFGTECLKERTIMLAIEYHSDCPGVDAAAQVGSYFENHDDSCVSTLSVWSLHDSRRGAR